MPEDNSSLPLEDTQATQPEISPEPAPTMPAEQIVPQGFQPPYQVNLSAPQSSWVPQPGQPGQPVFTQQPGSLAYFPQPDPGQFAPVPVVAPVRKSPLAG